MNVSAVPLNFTDSITQTHKPGMLNVRHGGFKRLPNGRIGPAVTPATVAKLQVQFKSNGQNQAGLFLGDTAWTRR